jgi:exodeoxyribonuclease V alpha subunit
MQACISAAEKQLSQQLNRDVQLYDGQRQALAFTLNLPASFLTGGPGCGKTLTIQAIAGQCSGIRLRMLAPTGDAAH